MDGLVVSAVHSPDHASFLQNWPAHNADTLAFAVCRVFSLNPVQDYIPPTLTGHRTTPVGVFWAGMQSCIRT